MLLVLPYEVRTLTQRSPWGNILAIALCVLIFSGFYFGVIPEAAIRYFILDGSNVISAVGSNFMHGGWGHLIGNMIFLWVFGNAICGVMPSTLYFVLFIILGATADFIHYQVDGRPCVGDSGAISGLMGVFLALYPLNRVHTFYLFIIKGGFWDAPGWVLLGLWFLLQLFSVFRGSDEIAYWAHIGGFVSGVGIGLLLTKFGWVDVGEYDNPNLLDIITRRAK